MAHDPVPAWLADSAAALDRQFGDLPAYEPEIFASSEAITAVLAEASERLGDNFPYFHPLYAGQMLKPPHPVARAAYALAMKINPNNHALDGGRASSAMELEAVSQLAEMFGWKEHLGHLTSSGTIANLEALWIAGQLHPGKRIVGSDQAHYTHRRISGVLNLEFSGIASDTRGRMRLDALEDELRRGDVGTVVATIGTTALGAVDPLHEILLLTEKYGVRVHADAAYGGYFGLIANELAPETRLAYEALTYADSIVIDPHKHGLQPYGCGCVLFRDASVGRLYKHDSPYTYFTSNKLHLGEISLECSRAGAAAVALWTTMKLLPLEAGGAFAQSLAKSRRAAMAMDRWLRADERFVGLGTLAPETHEASEGNYPPELDIVVWAMRGAGGQKCSDLARTVFDRCASQGLHLALVELPRLWFGASCQDENRDTVTCLRSVLMKPEHEKWLGAIQERLSAACASL